MENSQPEVGPLIVQGDNSILLDVHNPHAEEARADLGLFAELEKSPEHMHTYRITPLSLWNAASAGYSTEEILNRVTKWSRFAVPENIDFYIDDLIGRFGKLLLTPGPDENNLLLKVEDPMIYAELRETQSLTRYLRPTEEGFLVRLVDRGTIKSELIKLYYPIKDLAPLKEGEALNFKLLETTGDGYPFLVRDYQ